MSFFDEGVGGRLKVETGRGCIFQFTGFVLREDVYSTSIGVQSVEVHEVSNTKYPIDILHPIQKVNKLIALQREQCFFSFIQF